MVKSPEERENSLRRSLSQSDGDTPRGLDANSEVQQRAMQRYHRLLKTDRQLQVLYTTRLQPLLSHKRPCQCSGGGHHGDGKRLHAILHSQQVFNSGCLPNLS